jgi:hypothetical protein
LLDYSESIVQDDSGIPLEYFERRRWRLLAFGRYDGPISVFADFYQPRMAVLFQNANPIDFGIGYRWHKNESNLVVAQKQPVPDGEEGPTAQSQAELDRAIPPRKSRERNRNAGDAPVRLRLWESFSVLLVEIRCTSAITGAVL